MARERERQLRGWNSAAVVAHAYQTDAAVLDVDRELPRTGIERVLDQFLDDRRRALDHLARGDLVDERAFEYPDGHGMALRGDRRASLAARPASGAGDGDLEDRAGGDGLGFEVVLAPELVDADRVAAGNVDQRFARRHDVAQGLAALARG